MNKKLGIFLAVVIVLFVGIYFAKDYLFKTQEGKVEVSKLNSEGNEQRIKIIGDVPCEVQNLNGKSIYESTDWIYHCRVNDVGVTMERISGIGSEAKGNIIFEKDGKKQVLISDVFLENHYGSVGPSFSVKYTGIPNIFVIQQHPFTGPFIQNYVDINKEKIIFSAIREDFPGEWMGYKVQGEGIPEISIGQKNDNKCDNSSFEKEYETYKGDAHFIDLLVNGVVAGVIKEPILMKCLVQDLGTPPFTPHIYMDNIEPNENFSRLYFSLLGRGVTVDDQKIVFERYFYINLLETPPRLNEILSQ